MRGIFQTPSCTTYSYDFSDRIDSSVAMTLCRNTHPPSSAWLKQVPDRFSLLVVGWWHDTSVYVNPSILECHPPRTQVVLADGRPAPQTNSGCCLLDRLLTKTNVILVSFVCFLFVCADVLALWWEVHPSHNGSMVNGSQNSTHQLLNFFLQLPTTYVHDCLIHSRVECTVVLVTEITHSHWYQRFPKRFHKYSTIPVIRFQIEDEYHH